MIHSLGYYMTRDGQVVEMTRILESQPLAEGYLLKGGFRDTFHLWHTNGSSNRLKQTDRDIVRFINNPTDYELSND
jgi:hypothetical protein